jgi:hypothetical protein
MADRQSTDRALAVVRDGDGATQVRASRLPPAEREEMRERMNGDPPDVAPHWERCDKVYHQLSREGARRILATRELAREKARGR